MFVIPYEEDSTLIGTIEVSHDTHYSEPKCSEAEIDYLIIFVNNYFENSIEISDVVWTYSGVRPLYDDGVGSVTAAKRDYFVKLNLSAGAPALNIFGEKITTYRWLAESAMSEIDKIMCKKSLPWKAEAPLPRGDISIECVKGLRQCLALQLPFLDKFTIRRLIRQYGTQCAAIFRNIN